MKYEIFKPGWQQPVGWTPHEIVEPECIDVDTFAFQRVALRDFYLSHAATLFLLQGASLKQLFSDVVVKAGAREPDVYSLIFTSVPRIHAPPPRIDQVVLAHILERPVDLSPDQLVEQLFTIELARSAASSF